MAARERREQRLSERKRLDGIASRVFQQPHRSRGGPCFPSASLFGVGPTSALFLLYQVLLEDGVQVDAEDEIGETALHKACWRGSNEIVTVKTVSATYLWFLSRLFLLQLLLLNRASPSSRDNRGFTPMHNAVRKGHIESVKVGKTPLSAGHLKGVD